MLVSCETKLITKLQFWFTNALGNAFIIIQTSELPKLVMCEENAKILGVYISKI